MKVRKTTLFVCATLSLVACTTDDSSVSTSGPIDPTTEAFSTTASTAWSSATTLGTATLPIGDGKVSDTQPQVGWVFSCGLPHGGGGAFADGPWIDNATNTWDPSKKVHVSGSVTWPSKFSFELLGDSRAVDTNDFPNHATGIFPISPDNEAFNYDRNPNSINEHPISWTLPANPVKGDTPQCLNMGEIGVMTTGSILFSALDAEGRDAAAHETLDNCDGHPEITGAYHYHNLSVCNAAFGATEPTLVGWAADGFPIVTGLIDGHEVTNADLDVCHGRDTSVMIDGAVVDTYAYWMTAEYPYSLGCYWGTKLATNS